MEKMSFEKFKNLMKVVIFDYLPDGYKDTHVLLEDTTYKTNEKLTGLYLREKFPRTESVTSPTVYLEKVYQRYQDGAGLEYLAKSLAMALSQTPPEMDLKGIMSKDNIILRLVNAAANEKLLENRPYREFFDLAIIYDFLCVELEDGIGRCAITNELMKKLDVTEDELFELAISNTRRIYEPSWNSTIEEAMSEILPLDDPDAQRILEELEEQREFFENLPVQERMYILTHEGKCNGSVCILYTDILSKVAEMVGSSLYILPSSIHEVLAISTNTPMTLNCLSDLVYSVNMEQVEIQDRLSHNVYLFDRDTKKISIAAESVASLV